MTEQRNKPASNTTALFTTSGSAKDVLYSKPSQWKDEASQRYILEDGAVCNACRKDIPKALTTLLTFLDGIKLKRDPVTYNKGGSSPYMGHYTSLDVALDTVQLNT